VRFGKGFTEAMTKDYADLKTKISEVEVERWAGLVDKERQCSSV